MSMSRTRWSLAGVLGAALTMITLSGAPADLPQMEGVPTADPEAVGMSSERLERLDRAMRGYIDRDEVAGAVTLVARRGKVVHFSAQGDRDAAERGAAMMRPYTHLRIRDDLATLTYQAVID